MRGNWERAWRTDVGPRVLEVVTEGQHAAAAAAQVYMTDALTELGVRADAPGTLNLEAFTGVAGDGRSASSTLYGAVIHAAKAQYAPRNATLSPTRAAERALVEAEAWIEATAATLVADASRAAELVSMAQRPWVDGYVRAAEPGACSRCILLAGRFYLFNTGFLRHPSCRCFHLPAPQDAKKRRTLTDAHSPERYFESLTDAEQDRIFTKAGADAIREGADIGQVVNARRGMRNAQMGQQDVKITTEGTTRRGLASKTRIRLMPESIFEIADGDRDEALRLLKLYGYILP